MGYIFSKNSLFDVEYAHVLMNSYRLTKANLPFHQITFFCSNDMVNALWITSKQLICGILRIIFQSQLHSACLVVMMLAHCYTLSILETDMLPPPTLKKRNALSFVGIR